MTQHTFPTNIRYKQTEMVLPEDLYAGYFISQYDGDELFENSTIANDDLYFYGHMEGTDLLILKAGKHFDIATKESRWMVELLSANGNTLTLIGAKSMYDSDTRVNISRQSWSD